MRRFPELRDLSEDHHHGLVLARKAKRAAGGEEGSVADVWTEVETGFETELEPHFEIEESVLAPLLEAHGEAELVERLLGEHVELRKFVAPDSPRTAEALNRFGDSLERHIRFEERELFEVAQQTLTADELAEVANASRARRGA